MPIQQTELVLNQQRIVVEHDSSKVIDRDKIRAAMRLAQEKLLLTTLNLTKAYAFTPLNGYLSSLSPDFLDLLNVSFKLPAPDAPDSEKVYLQALRRILDTVTLIRDAMTADMLELHDMEADVERDNPSAHGYVTKTLGEGLAEAVRPYSHDLSKVRPLVNPIHVKLDDDEQMLAWYTLHEASHKFALTVDVGSGSDTAYFDGIDRCKDRKRRREGAQAMLSIGATDQKGRPQTLESLLMQDVFARKMARYTCTQLLDNADSYSHFLMIQPDTIT